MNIFRLVTVFSSCSGNKSTWLYFPKFWAVPLRCACRNHVDWWLGLWCMLPFTWYILGKAPLAVANGCESEPCTLSRHNILLYDRISCCLLHDDEVNSMCRKPAVSDLQSDLRGCETSWVWLFQGCSSLGVPSLSSPLWDSRCSLGSDQNTKHSTQDTTALGLTEKFNIDSHWIKVSSHISRIICRAVKGIIAYGRIGWMDSSVQIYSLCLHISLL